MPRENKIKKILDFAAAEKLAVIATVGENGQPQAALVGFTEISDLKIIIGTTRRNRKHLNLLRDARVALVIGLSGPVTVQYEGKAVELYGKEREDYQNIFLEKHPGAAKYMQDPDEASFLIKPTWVRYTDYDNKPMATFEITFD